MQLSAPSTLIGWELFYLYRIGVFMEQEREDRFVILRFDVLERKDLSASEKIVYARICGFKKYFESKEICAQVTGVSESTVVKAKQKLVKLGYVKEIGNTGRGKIYQPVLDDHERVAKSANQSSKKAPIRVADSANIEEREKKERVKSITNVIGASTVDEYGRKEDINDMFDYWRATVGYEISSRRQANRYACSNLLKKYKATGLKQLIDATAAAQADRYAPRVSDFSSLQSKLNDLIAWARKKGQSNASARF